METMSGFMLLTFWLCAGVNYIMLRNMSKRQKGLLLGVTLPPEAGEDPAVQAVVKRFRRQLGGCSLLCAVSAVPLAFVKDTDLFLTLWMFWFFVGLLLPYLPLFGANTRLKALKKVAAGQNAPTRVVDTAASAFALPKPMGLWTLLPPLVLSLAPIALPGLPRGLMLVCGIDAACVLLLWGLGRWDVPPPGGYGHRGLRPQPDPAPGAAALLGPLLAAEPLGHGPAQPLSDSGLPLRGCYPGPQPWLYRPPAGRLALDGVFGPPAQAALTETAPIVADEDDAWVGGIFYYNPTDKRFLVAKRIGLGSTVNLGTWAGKLYYAFVGLVLVVCLAIGPIFGIVDSIPVRLELSGSAPVCLVASHGQSEKYRLDTDAITDVQLRDTLPDAARTWGTGMDHYLQGDFYVIGEGNARFCLDPTQKCFLRVEAGGQVYWFTGDSEDHTAAIAQALQSAVHP